MELLGHLTIRAYIQAHEYFGSFQSLECNWESLSQYLAPLAAVALEIEPMLAAEAKVRQQAALKKGTSSGVPPLAKELANADSHDNRAAEQAAKAMGTNRQYVADVAVAESETAAARKGDEDTNQAFHPRGADQMTASQSVTLSTVTRGFDIWVRPDLPSSQNVQELCERLDRLSQKNNASRERSDRSNDLSIRHDLSAFGD